ncbi:MAG: winged helix-turn-helix domain-containing protein [Thermoproteota archaeon]|nr:winged helix-turn-helix domain-containing protein [Thermoproteota archaeon]
MSPSGSFNPGHDDDDDERDGKKDGRNEDRNDREYKSKKQPDPSRHPNDRRIRSSGGEEKGHVDPHFKRVLWYLIGSTRGGVNRAKILDFLVESPSNTNQIASQLGLDYKTIVHHLDVLVKNSLIIIENEGSYGSTYFISPLLEKNYFVLEEIMDKIGKK